MNELLSSLIEKTVKITSSLREPIAKIMYLYDSDFVLRNLFRLWLSHASSMLLSIWYVIVSLTVGVWSFGIIRAMACGQFTDKPIKVNQTKVNENERRLS